MFFELGPRAAAASKGEGFPVAERPLTVGKESLFEGSCDAADDDTQGLDGADGEIPVRPEGYFVEGADGEIPDAA